MRKTILRLTRLAGILAFLLPSHLMAAEAATGIVIVADTRHLSGIQAWWANLYNEGHLEFALLTIIIIPVSGVILGTLADFLMSFIGIDLKSRALREG